MLRIKSSGKIVVLSFLLALCVAGCPGIYQPGDTVYPAAIDAGDSAAIRAILDSNGLKNVAVRKVIDQYSKGKINYLTIDSLGLDSFTFTPDFERLDSIKMIGLSFNLITKINVPESLKLSHLGVILNNNLLDSFPLCLLKIASNIGIRVEHNQITSVPQELTRSSSVVVDFYYNKLCNVSDTVASWLDSTNLNWRSVQSCP